MTDPHEAPPETPPSSRRRPASVRIGLAVFLIGLVFVLVTVLPFFWGEHNRPVWLNLACMLAPLGLVIAVIGVIRQGRAEQRAVLAQLHQPHR